MLIPVFFSPFVGIGIGIDQETVISIGYKCVAPDYFYTFGNDDISNVFAPESRPWLSLWESCRRGRLRGEILRLSGSETIKQRD